MKRTDRLRVTREVRTVLGWPSDTFAIDYHATRDAHTPEFPHTVLVFVPGNPGLTEWYVPMFTELVQRLGPGFAARGIANAGHSTHDSHVDVEQWKDEPDREACVPWTIDGQAYHKAAYTGNVMDELDALKKRLALPDSIESPRFIVVAHSIGVHFAQRMFMLRPIILHRTCLLISLMPFMRMKAPKLQQRLLDFVAGRPEQTIRVHAGAMHILKRLPFQWVDRMMRSTMPDAKGRKVAVELLRQPAFARNFFTLGLEEIREVPEECDVRQGGWSPNPFSYFVCTSASHSSLYLSGLYSSPLGCRAQIDWSAMSQHYAVCRQ